MFSTKNIIKPTILSKKVGVSDSCPYCEKKLTKIPKRKKKCEFCGQFIYSRTRPQDRRKVLLTKDQADLVELQWQIINETNEIHNWYGELVETSWEELKKQFGREPTIKDLKWKIYDEELMKHASNGDWELYRNTRLGMGDLLEYERKIKESLLTLLEVCYLDSNGPQNTGGGDEEYNMNSTAFNPEERFLAPGVINMIRSEIEQLGLLIPKVKDMFIQHNTEVQKSLKLPLSPEKAWERILEPLTIPQEKYRYNQHKKREHDRLLRFKEQGLKKVIVIATLDKFTCPVCRKLNGKITILDDALKKMPVPCSDCTTYTKHTNRSNYGSCRCTYRPVLAT